jgi:hypothetical protein
MTRCFLCDPRCNIQCLRHLKVGLRGQKTFVRLKNRRNTSETSPKILHAPPSKYLSEWPSKRAQRRNKCPIEATRVCITTGNSEMVLAALCKSPQRLWSDTDTTEILRFTNRSTLAGDLQAKHPVWNSNISNPSVFQVFETFVICNSEISTAQSSTHYALRGRGNVPNV